MLGWDKDVYSRLDTGLAMACGCCGNHKSYRLYLADGALLILVIETRWCRLGIEFGLRVGGEDGARCR